MKLEQPTQIGDRRSDSLKIANSVLVVDDEKLQRDLLALTLSGTQKVRSVSSVAEAITEVERELPSLVIMDYSMPGVSGIEGLKQLRELHPALPVIILTGHADIEIAREALRLGAMEYMIKPFEAADLIEMVSRLTSDDAEAFDETSDVLTENAPNPLRRSGANVDLWRGGMPTVSSENRIVASFESGLQVEAKVLRLNNSLVHAEIYDAIPRLAVGDKVASLQVWVGDDLGYDGAATLTNIIATGVARICEFALEEQWTTDLSAGQKGLQVATQRFLARWEATHEISPEFKLAVAHGTAFITEMRAWLEGMELSWRQAQAGRDGSKRQMCEQLLEQVTPALNEAFTSFEKEAGKVSEEQTGLYAEYFRASLHPLILCSPFVHRCFTKPLGYPGDFGVMNRMLDDPFEGDSLFSIIINAWVIRSAAGAAYRNRVHFLDKALDRETRRIQETQGGRVCRVLSLGCGAAREVQRFIGHNPLSVHTQFNLFDFNPATVQHASERISQAMAESGREVSVKVTEFSVQQMLAQGSRLLTQPRMIRSGMLEKGHYDVIYCAGLFDYLSDRVCKRLLDIFWTLGAPGASIIVSNFTPTNPIRGFMDHALDWRLIYREEQHMYTVVPEECGPGAAVTELSPDKVEVFLQLRKPDAPVG